MEQFVLYQKYQVYNIDILPQRLYIAKEGASICPFSVTSGKHAPVIGNVQRKSFQVTGGFSFYGEKKAYLETSCSLGQGKGE